LLLLLHVLWLSCTHCEGVAAGLGQHQAWLLLLGLGDCLHLLQLLTGLLLQELLGLGEDLGEDLGLRLALLRKNSAGVLKHFRLLLGILLQKSRRWLL